MTDWPWLIAISLMWITTAINVGALVGRKLRKEKVNCDMEEAIDKYLHDPSPNTVFAMALQAKHPDGNCELRQVLREYREWKERVNPGTPLRMLNDGFVVEAILRGLDKNPPDES